MQETDQENNCNRLFDYFEGRLSAAQEEALLQWLQADESHKRIFSEMGDWWAIAHVPRFEAERKQNFETHFATLTTPKPAIERRTLRISFWRNIAVSLLVLISVSVFCYQLGKTYTEKDLLSAQIPTAVTETEIVSQFGSVTQVILPDGTVTWLNAGSTLTYTNEYNKQSRVVKLTGEAYFDVKPNTQKSFIVQSKDLEVKVTGTRFNVKAYSNDETIDVSLLSGSVNVLLNEGTRSGEVLSLTPNHILSYEKESSTVTISDANANDAIAWSSGEIKFTKQPFSRLAKDLERKFNVRIVLESAILKNEIFTGSFLQHHSLGHILHEIDMDKKYTWQWMNEDMLIIRDK